MVATARLRGLRLGNEGIVREEIGCTPGEEEEDIDVEQDDGRCRELYELRRSRGYLSKIDTYLVNVLLESAKFCIDDVGDFGGYVCVPPIESTLTGCNE